MCYMPICNVHVSRDRKQIDDGIDMVSFTAGFNYLKPAVALGDFLINTIIAKIMLGMKALYNFVRIIFPAGSLIRIFVRRGPVLNML